jgi:Methyltransferase domain
MYTGIFFSVAVIMRGLVFAHRVKPEIDLPQLGWREITMITPSDSGVMTRRREGLKQEARNPFRPGRIFLEVQYLKRRIFLEFGRWGYGKTDLVHLVSKRLSLTNYLELCTSTTGQCYGDIMPWRFSSSRRLMYNFPDGFDDGYPIDFRIGNFDISSALDQLKADASKIDICLVDGFHTYDCAIRDLKCAFELLSDGGVLVVHDCLPPSESVASPTWIPGDWAGVSYRAYLDFVLARNDSDYCTVDVDWGCGIIVKNDNLSFMTDAPSFVRKSKLASDWFSIHNNDKAALKFFMQNHKQLLRLISAGTFVHGLGRNFVRATPIWVILVRAIWRSSRRAAAIFRRGATGTAGD